MGVAPKKKLALDTNVLFDLANESDFTHTFREVHQERGYSLEVPPTVIQELSHLALETHCNESALALKALQKIRSWGLLPFDLIPTGHALAEQFSKKLIDKGFLPEGEFNDGLILAETALVSIPILATSDKHLLHIDNAVLRVQLEDSDLSAVSVVHPKTLLGALAPY